MKMKPASKDFWITFLSIDFLYLLGLWLYSYYQVNSFEQVTTLIGTIATVGATLVALWQAIDNRNNIVKQLQIEQEPYVIATGDLVKDNPQINIKNVGRGSALKINADKALFREDQQFEINLSGNEKGEWIFNDQLIKDKNSITLRFEYKDQFGKNYRTVCMLKEERKGRLQVMSNEVQKL